MNIFQPINYGTVGTNVWATTVRTLSTFVGPMAITESINQALAASTAVSFHPAAANSYYTATIGATAGAAGTTTFAMNDGVHGTQILSIAAGASGCSSVNCVTQNFQLKISNNDAVNAMTYAISVALYQ